VNERDKATELVTSKTLACVAWAGLVRAADARTRGTDAAAGPPVLTEQNLRWVQWGWLE
jgi:hypothetical protein